MINRSAVIFLMMISLLAGRAQAQEIQLADTTTACRADSVLLDAGPGFLSYLWNTGEQTQTIFAREPGWYDVLCMRENMEMAEDSTFVMFFDASIQQPDTILTCYKYPVLLCVEPDTLQYVWTSNDPDLTIEYDTAACIQITPPNDTTTVYVHITDSLNILTCIDSVQIWLYPRMHFDEINQINTGCPGTCRGQLQVLVSGGLPPYLYFWPTTQPRQYDSIAFGLCEAEYKIEVTDQYNCVRDTLLPVEVFDMPTVNIIRDPDEQLYIQNPVVNFSFENQSIDSIQIIDWNWDFGDTTFSKQEFPEKVFDMVREYEVMLKYTTSNECVDSVILKVDIAEVNLKVPNVFTPNGDGFNDLFAIKDLEYYMSNEIAIFNRYGKKVYSRNNYQGDWDGGNLRDGVYFYVLRAKGYFGTDTFKGSISIMR
jgi:gliding motility-associated-like protein